jgi:beta-galactosidase GanA
MSVSGTAVPLPALRAGAGATQVVVDGEVTLLLGGQLHNSASSDPEHMRRALDHLAEMNVGTVIGSASWGLMEPAEGAFDFAHVDAQITAARDRGLRLVLIWFGAYKNAASTYAPRWVRSDTERFPRAVVGEVSKEVFTYPGAMPKPVLSVFAPDLLAADRAAFVALMEHLASADPDHVVVMVQVENEIGLLGDSRDRSPASDEAWGQQVPKELVAHLEERADRLDPDLAELWGRGGRRTTGTWPEVFGEGWEAEEVFMAWAFGSHVEALARAGKAVKPLPMYVNAWLGPQPGQSRPGEYPSGGPTSRVLDVWKAAAPSIDLLAPDIYVDDAQTAMSVYDRPDNPLFIPETRFRTGSLFWALGHHRAIGFSVFGIEDGRVDSQLAHAYALVGPLIQEITAAQAEGRIAGILLDEGHPEMSFQLGGLDVVARSSRGLLGRMLLDAGVQPPPPPPPRPSETEGSSGPPAPRDTRPFGLLVAEGDDTFLLVGQGITVDFSAPRDTLEVDQVEERRFQDGRWTRGRLLNGDERLHVVPFDDLGAARITLLRTPGGQ